MLLQKEFPTLKSYNLPPYNIKYAKKGKNLKFKLFLSVPSIIIAVKRERKLITKIVEKENIAGVISDNRFGVLCKKIPSVYITHQLKVLSGITTFLTSKIHQKIIAQFDECWVPDLEGSYNFSEKLGHLKKHSFKLKYLGVLSRFKQQNLPIKYDLMVLLSGPEPHRTLLEKILLKKLKNYNGKVLFVRGVLNEKKKITISNNFKVTNYLLKNELEKAISQSNIIIARSGYSTIMDLAVLGKKAFLIPTPGQFEQEYLAKKLNEKLIAPFTTQQNFSDKHLSVLNRFSGFKASKTAFNLELFSLFNGK